MHFFGKQLLYGLWNYNFGIPQIQCFQGFRICMVTVDIGDQNKIRLPFSFKSFGPSGRVQIKNFIAPGYNSCRVGNRINAYQSWILTCFKIF